MRIPREVVEEVRRRTDIVELIGSYVTLKRAGSNFGGLCPFHSEKTPSFTVFPDSESFYCFGCGAGGDIINFISKIENLDYIDAVKLLGERCGVAVVETEKDDTLHNLKNTILEINRETARFYYSNLFKPEGKWALDYYLSRGLTPETVKSFGLGVALSGWDTLTKHLRSKGFKFEDMLQADVVSKSNKGTYFDRFRDRTMFPVINVRGNTVKIRITSDASINKYGFKTESITVNR